MGNNRAITDEERKILERNGIDPNHLAVTHRTDTSIYLLRFQTRDIIVVHQGDKKWCSWPGSAGR